VGRPNVGKSTLLNALVGEPIAIISHHPQTTRDPVRGVVTQGGTQFVFVDTPGLHTARTRLGNHMNQVARETARDADAVVFVVAIPPDSDDPADTRPAKPHPEDVALLSGLPESLPILLVINKIDRLKDISRLLPFIEAFSKIREFHAIVPVSARKADGLSHILDELAPLLPEQPRLYDEDTLSDQPVRFFVAEFVREQILKRTREEVPHGVAVVVERFDESADVPVIELAIHVDKESHKKIVIGARGALMKAIGIDARRRIEQTLGRQVHLKLWVRVTPGWYENEARLRELGYGGRREAPPT
jgi:GTP-binding protein Era